jgi:hypothetical protein
MANNVLVLRAGEVIRGLVISRLAGIALPAAWASIAIERVFDAMTLVALLVLALAAGASAQQLRLRPARFRMAPPLPGCPPPSWQVWWQPREWRRSVSGRPC